MLGLGPLDSVPTASLRLTLLVVAAHVLVLVAVQLIDGIVPVPQVVVSYLQWLALLRQPEVKKVVKLTHILVLSLMFYLRLFALFNH